MRENGYLACRLKSCDAPFAAYTRGDLHEAERLSRSVTAAKPNRFDAWRLLGFVQASMRRGASPNMAAEALGEDFDPGPDAFVDTAAVMTRLDLVLTCDTSIAHLAGALGRPVWVALKKESEWRWLRGRDDSPWYPTMRLFRQERRGEWRQVFSNMAACAAPLAKARGRLRPGVNSSSGAPQWVFGLAGQPFNFRQAARPRASVRT